LEILNQPKKEISEVIMRWDVEPSNGLAKESGRSEETVMNISTARAYFQQGELSESRY
jgi:hypothetical protein